MQLLESGNICSHEITGGVLEIRPRFLFFGDV